MPSRLKLKGFRTGESYFQDDGRITVLWSDSYVTRVT